MIPPFLNLRMRTEGIQASVTLHISRELFNYLEAAAPYITLEGFEVFQNGRLFYASVVRRFSYRVCVEDIIAASYVWKEELCKLLARAKIRLNNHIRVHIWDKKSIPTVLDYVESHCKAHRIPIDIVIKDIVVATVYYKDRRNAEVKFFM